MATFTHETEGLDVVKEFKQLVEGKTILITGASEKGLGAGTAIALAHGKPAHLILLARSENKVKPVISEIEDIDKAVKTTFVPVELDDLDSVRKAAATINSSVDKIDYFINNAGIMAVTKYTVNKAGLESQLATNHLGHFLLTNLLMSKILSAGKGARIVNVTSEGHEIGPFRFEDYNFSEGKRYDPWSAYGQSKTANILFTQQLAVRLAKRDTQSFAIHPGFIGDTSLGAHLDVSTLGDIDPIAVRNTGKHFELSKPKTPEQGISTTLVAILDPRVADKSGAYLVDCNIAEARDYATDPENAKKLWKLSEELVGEKFDL